MQTPSSPYNHFIIFPVLVFTTISFTLPTAYNSIAIILLFIAFLIDIKNMGHRFRAYYKNKSNIFLFLIFLSLLISLLYSDDKDTGIKGILSAVPLVILPLSLAGLNGIDEKKMNTLKKIYVLACVISSFVYLVLAVIRSGMISGSYKLIHAPENYYAYFVSQLTYNHLSPSIHAIFYSLYIALAVFIIIFDFKKRSVRSKILYGLLILYFLVYNFLLISITINFALYSFLAIYFYVSFTFRKHLHYFLFFGTILVGTAATVYLIAMKYLGPLGDGTYRFDQPGVNKKILFAFAIVILTGLIAIFIKLIFSKKYLYVIASIIAIALIGSYIYFQSNNIKDLKENNISVRFKYGHAAINVIKEHPLVGIGIGDKKNSSVMNAEDLPPGAAPEHVFNSHNQFLDLWVAAGIIPFFCLILFLYNELKKAVQLRHIIYTGLVYCFCLFCFTDSALLAQRGQVFFIFFIWLFTLENKKRKWPI